MCGQTIQQNIITIYIIFRFINAGMSLINLVGTKYFWYQCQSCLSWVFDALSLQLRKF